MIVIKRENYEKFFIDYLEGTLSKSEVNQLFSFLIANPDLKLELDELENQKLVPEITAFTKKLVLKKTAVLANQQETNFDELCIASIEGDLNEIQLVEFDKLIEDNTNLKKQLALFEKTILIPDSTITYSNKSALKKAVFAKKQKIGYQYLSIAASVALLIALSVFVPKSIHENNKNDLQLSSLNNEKEVAVAKENNSVTQEFKKEVSINQNVVINDNQSAKESIGNNFSFEKINTETREVVQPLIPSSISIVENENILFADLKIVDLSSYELAQTTNSTEPSSLKDVLVRSFNKKILKKESDLNTINTYDFADLAISGVNKIVGTKMSLNKKYDASGNVTDLEFNSRLIAFSTPVKK